MRKHFIMSVCKQCNQPFTAPRRPSRPNPNPQFCSRVCYRAWQGEHGKDYQTFECRQCGKAFGVPPWQAKEKPQFCCSACHLTWKTPVKHMCEYCGKEFMARKDEKRPRQYCSNKCQGEVRRRRETRLCLECGKEFTCQLCSRQKFCCRSCQGRGTVKYRCAPPRISSIEYKMRDAFEQAGLHPTQQYMIDRFCLDLAFVEQKLAVECDGDYWHNLQNVRLKDAKKDELLRSQGWNVVRLWEHEINLCPADCVARVQAELQSLTP